MKRLFLGMLFAVLASGALAVDKPQRQQNVRVFNYDWSGTYVGIQGGYGFNGNVNSPGLVSIENDSWFVGGYVGVNRQYGPVVLGLEVEGSFADFNGAGAVGPIVVTHEVKAFGSAKVRAGYAAGPWLVFVDGGVAVAKADATLSAGAFSTSASPYHVGYTVGAGIEAMLTGNWVGRVQYSYADFGCTNYGFPVAGVIGVVVPGCFDIHAVRTGLHYRF